MNNQNHRVASTLNGGNNGDEEQQKLVSGNRPEEESLGRSQQSLRDHKLFKLYENENPILGNNKRFRVCLVCFSFALLIVGILAYLSRPSSSSQFFQNHSDDNGEMTTTGGKDIETLVVPSSIN